tara:strand:- start:59 stop:574 length:516 start_codon:yes stop_codon:yes gene_type:complete
MNKKSNHCFVQVSRWGGRFEKRFKMKKMFITSSLILLSLNTKSSLFNEYEYWNQKSLEEFQQSRVEITTKDLLYFYAKCTSVTQVYAYVFNNKESTSISEMGNDFAWFSAEILQKFYPHKNIIEIGDMVVEESKPFVNDYMTRAKGTPDLTSITLDTAYCQAYLQFKKSQL